MKKLSFASIILIILCFILAGCNDPVYMDILYVGDTFSVWRADSPSDAGICVMDITYDGCYAENIGGESVLLCQTLTFTVYHSVSLSQDDFRLNACYYQDDSQNWFDMSVEYNMEKNGYDITENMLETDTVYTFCYIVPSTLNNKKYSDIEIYFKVYGVYFAC